jgi:phage shock protein A
MRVFARIYNLVRGSLSTWIGGREHRHPEAVYESAIQERSEQYAKLRAAAAGVLYLRSKLTKQLEATSRELARVRAQLDLAVERDEDAVALALIGRRDALDAESERLTAELAELTAEADAAKQNLIAFQGDIARLREEKVRMLARLANAKARLRFQATLAGLAPDADIRALEGVREHINRLVEETKINRDLGDTELERKLGKIRETEADAGRRAQLDELKRARGRGLLPMVMVPAERETVAVRRAGLVGG